MRQRQANHQQQKTSSDHGSLLHSAAQPQAAARDRLGQRVAQVARHALVGRGCPALQLLEHPGKALKAKGGRLAAQFVGGATPRLPVISVNGVGKGGGGSVKPSSEEPQQLLDQLRIVGALFQQAGLVRQAFLFLRTAVFRRADAGDGLP